MDSCKSLVKRKHGSKTPSVWCQVAFKIYMQGASHHHQLEVKPSLRHLIQSSPIGPFHQDRAFEVLCHLLGLCSSVRKGERSPSRGPFPWQHSVSAKHLQLAFPWEGLPSGAWQRGGIFFEVLPLFPFSSHRCSLERPPLILGLMLACCMESELLFPQPVRKAIRERMLLVLPPPPISVCSRSQDVTSSFANSFLFS